MESISLEASPLIIIGAGRSGTNMLRDVLTRLDGIETWPCDEINYIWRHGNKSYPTDEFTVDMATPSVQRYVRSCFLDLARKSPSSDGPVSSKYVLEKTCANSLRVPFVDKLIPEARYIHIIRDGRDVVSSALNRWKAPLDIPYLAAKARYVPLTDLPYYASRYFLNRLSKIKNTESSVAVWGPRFEGMELLAKSQPLETVCATQWSRCVEMSRAAFSNMDEKKYIEVRYEDFVANPVSELEKISTHLELDFSREEFKQASSIVRTDSVGKGRQSSNLLSKTTLLALNEMQVKCGYQV